VGGEEGEGEQLAGQWRVTKRTMPDSHHLLALTGFCTHAIPSTGIAIFIFITLVIQKRTAQRYGINRIIRQ
jgi:hypothetical protein